MDKAYKDTTRIQVLSINLNISNSRIKKNKIEYCQLKKTLNKQIINNTLLKSMF